MSDSVPVSRPLTVLRSRPLRGRFEPPSEPAIAALALLLAALARGETVIYADTGLAGPDVAAALRVAAAVGAGVERHDDRWQVSGLGPLGLLEPLNPLDFSGAGRTLPFAMGLLGPYGFTSRFEAREDVPAMPRGLGHALRALGVEVKEQRSGQLPLGLRGPRMGVPMLWRAPSGMGSDGITAMLLAGLALPGVSTLAGMTEPPGHAIRLLRHFGAEIATTERPDGWQAEITGLAPLGARTLSVAGDPELATLVMLAALIVPESDLRIENVLLDRARRGAIDTLVEMGGNIEVLERRQAAGEEVADFRVQQSPLLGTVVEPGGLSLAALPALAVAGAFAAGETRIPRFGLVGEVGLHRRLAELLVANGAIARADASGLTVHRPPPDGGLGGGSVPADVEPLVAGACLVLGLGSPEPVTLFDSAALEAWAPAFIPGFEGLGVEFYRRRPG